MKEVGTLKEIGAQVGDRVAVVGWHENHSYVLGIDHMGRFCDADDGVKLLERLEWRIVSRAKPCPVREVARKEIVPGVYGRLRISEAITASDDVCIAIIGGMAFSAHELTATIETMTQIRDAMKENQA